MRRPPAVHRRIASVRQPVRLRLAPFRHLFHCAAAPAAATDVASAAALSVPESPTASAGAPCTESVGIPGAVSAPLTAPVGIPCVVSAPSAAPVTLPGSAAAATVRSSQLAIRPCLASRPVLLSCPCRFFLRVYRLVLLPLKFARRLSCIALWDCLVLLFVAGIASLQPYAFSASNE